MRTLDVDNREVLGRVRRVVEQGFSCKSVAVLGDLMVDEYIVGKVERLSPEAPIPVMTDGQTTRAAGGAANVALNLRHLGARVLLSGVVGSDEAGSWLYKALNDAGVDVDGVVLDGSRPTTIKSRFRTERQQILRVDREVTEPIGSAAEQHIIRWLMNRGDACQALVLSDYCKGVLSHDHVVSQVVGAANRMGLVIGVDTKSQSPERFGQVTFCKPNEREMLGATRGDCADRTSAALAYLERTAAFAVVVTLGERGIIVVERDAECIHVPTVGSEVYDVTGAGDSVMAAVVLGLLHGLSFADSALLGNAAARVVIRKAGTATLLPAEVLDELEVR